MPAVLFFLSLIIIFLCGSNYLNVKKLTELEKQVEQGHPFYLKDVGERECFRTKKQVEIDTIKADVKATEDRLKKALENIHHI